MPFFVNVSFSEHYLYYLTNMAHENRINSRLTVVESVKAVTLIQEGRTQSFVAQQLGFTQSAISRVYQRYLETGQYTRRPGQGRKRATNAVQDRFIRLNALRTRFLTTRALKNELLDVHQLNLSIETIRKRLKEDNITAKVPARGPILTAAHRAARLQFARDHLDWEADDWARVLFSDESRFCLNKCDRRARVFRRPGERYAQCNILQVDNFGGGGVMVWGGIQLEARTDLEVIRFGTMNSERYITDILEPHVVPFAPFIGPNFIFMQDNARPHTAHIVREYIETVGITVMDWAARSPDLNPIEHVWDIMGRQYRALPNPPNNLIQLEVALRQIWENIPQEVITRLILSMPQRCQAVVAARGGNTKY